ncbi:hypothetical protein RQP46_008839 [Phenoliferia psychrophenolica]
MVALLGAVVPPPPPRRVSYVLPPPSDNEALPVLGLPPWDVLRRGHAGPLYSVRAQQHSHQRTTSELKRGASEHPRHRLAVQALALDLSTALAPGSSSSPEVDPAPGGILYTGGRDGLVSSWELGLPTRRRKTRYGQSSPQQRNGGPPGSRSSAQDHASDDSDSSLSDDGSDEDRDRARRDVPAHEDLDRLGSRTVSVSSRKRLRRDASGGSGAGAAHARRDSSADTTTRFNISNDQLPLEDRWEVDPDRILGSPAPPAKFRQCIQSHTDWVNDLVLCNYNRTLVSASSDSLLVAWNPHSNDHGEQVTPNQIGRHGDYVRCLASARDAGWVASGGFDRKIKLWDLTEGRSTPALELPSPPASIYSLAATPSGSLLAVGTPERVIRVYDPSSRRQVSRLGGHTDNVRAVLLSDDGKWVLSASSDSTVKLWSLTAQRCLHTFSHHSSSVWSLASQHPSLERFYSGDRQGNICKIDIEGAGDPGDGECILLARDSPDETGEVRTGYEGITQVVAQDDAWVWSAGGSSSVKRWRDVIPRKHRAGAIALRPRQTQADSSSAVFDPTLSTSSASEVPDYGTPPIPESPPAPERDRSNAPSVTFLQDLTSPLSRTESSPSTPTFNPVTASQFSTSGRPSSLRTRPSSTRAARQSLEGASHPSFLSSPASESSPAITTSAPPTISTLNEIPYDALVPLTSPDDTYFSPGISSRHRDPDASTQSLYSSSVLSVPYTGRPSLSASPSTQAFFRPQSLVETPADPESQAALVARREFIERESASEATPLRTGPDDVIAGRVGLTRCELLNDRRHALTVNTEGSVALWDIVECRCLGVFAQDELISAARRPSDARSTASGSGSSGGQDSPQDLLDFVKDRVEGEGSVATWCKCDTRVGALTVHLEEQRVFDAEIYVDEAHIGPAASAEYPPDHRLHLGKWVLRQLFDGFIEAEMQLRAPHMHATPTQSNGNSNNRSAGDHPRFISLSDLGATPSSPRALKTPGMTIALATPALRKAVLSPLPSSPTILMTPRNALWDLPAVSGSPIGTPRLFDPKQPGTPTDGTRTPTGSKGGTDYFSLLPTSAEPPKKGEDLPTAGGTLMGRLRMIGKSSKRPTTGEVFDQGPVPENRPVEETLGQEPKVVRTLEEEQQYQILDLVLSLPLTPCPTYEAPQLRFRPDMAILISEETPDAAAWGVTYRGIIGTSSEDVCVLEQKAPFWLLEFLLGNRIPVKDPVKISFVIQPWMDTVRAGLPELPNANARLTANRTLRIRKVMGYIADKLDLRESATASRAASISGDAVLHMSAPPTESSHDREGFIPERDLEILCGDVLMTGRMTLATARAFYWKQGGDLVLSYRLKQQVPV